VAAAPAAFLGAAVVAGARGRRRRGRAAGAFLGAAVVADAGRVAAAPASSFSGVCYRHQAPAYDPLDGTGARIHGGRFTPPGSYPTLYLCTTMPCAVAELARLGQRQVIGVEALLPRAVYEYRISLGRVLDLTSPTVRETLGLRLEDVTSPDWSLTQEVGSVAHALDFQAVRSPSALGVDEVLAVFTLHLADQQLETQLLTTWQSRADLEGAEDPR
jgi:RES domain-containing protein